MSMRTGSIAMALLSLLGIRAVYTATASSVQTMAAIGSSDSVLVIAPHPDDESLCCAGLIDLARRTGAQVSIVWLTAGDGFRFNAMVVGRTLRPGVEGYRNLARRRIAEGREAAEVLGVPRTAQFVLGYPDRSLLPLVFNHYAAPWRSRRTGTTAVFFEEAVFPGNVYEGRNLERDLTWIVDQVHPTLVLAPSPQDTHPDHRGAGLLTLRVMAQRGELDRIRYWIVHGGRGWPSPRALRPDLPQTVPPRGRQLVWESVTLDPAALETKRRAIETHWTQRKVMGRVMQSYLRATELYARTHIPPSDALCDKSSVCVSAELLSSDEDAL